MTERVRFDDPKFEETVSRWLAEIEDMESDVRDDLNEAHVIESQHNSESMQSESESDEERGPSCSDKLPPLRATQLANNDSTSSSDEENVIPLSELKAVSAYCRLGVAMVSELLLLLAMRGLMWYIGVAFVAWVPDIVRCPVILISISENLLQERNLETASFVFNLIAVENFLPGNKYILYVNKEP
ncbi:hypothetical protein FQA39_LY04421 [Lamprigera yunnana]|nr:hypothetical protein FQA39_LY04421 [Lamprigera yunnana]